MYELAIKSVDEKWRDIIEECGGKEIIDTLPDEDICPRPADIFNAFKLTPYDLVKVIIIGQDPYPNIEDACGLAFSTKYENHHIPASLRNIYKALRRLGYMDIVDHGCLEGWAKQGVLLLNTALTCRIGKSNSHSKLWEKFTQKLVGKLNGIYLLWGNNAKKLKPFIKYTAEILEYGHPSPLSRVDFSSCDHFRAVNLRLDVPIMWDPNYDPYYYSVVFTDGHCSNNGRENASAGWGAYAPKTYKGHETNISFKKHGPVIGEQTNNRAELQAVIESLKILLKYELNTLPVILVTDSKYVYNIIMDWIWRDGWVSTHKNSDMTNELKKLLFKMRNKLLSDHALKGLFSPVVTDIWPGLTVKLVRASHDLKKSDDDDYLGNEMADALAHMK